jgi:hypothetical protein
LRVGGQRGDAVGEGRGGHGGGRGVSARAGQLCRSVGLCVPIAYILLACPLKISRLESRYAIA